MVLAKQGKGLNPVRERRRRVADELYEGLTEGGCHFWNDVYPMFMERDLTRADLRLLIRKGLGTQPRQLSRRCCSCSAWTTRTTSGC